jgi:hypothetical protein
MKEILKRSYGGNWGRDRGESVSTIQQHGDGDITVATYQDPTRVLESNKDLRNDPTYDGKFQDDDWGQRVASVPTLVALRWRNELGVDIMNPAHSQRVLQLLDDPDYAHCKVVDEKVAKSTHRAFMKASTAPPEIVVAKEMPSGG